MNTAVKINPTKKYESAKQILSSRASQSEISSDISKIDGSIDSLKTVIDVLMERATPKARTKSPKINKEEKRYRFGARF